MLNCRCVNGNIYKLIKQTRNKSKKKTKKTTTTTTTTTIWQSKLTETVPDYPQIIPLRQRKEICDTWHWRHLTITARVTRSYWHHLTITRRRGTDQMGPASAEPEHIDSDGTVNKIRITEFCRQQNENRQVFNERKHRLFPIRSGTILISIMFRSPSALICIIST